MTLSSRFNEMVIYVASILKKFSRIQRRDIKKHAERNSVMTTFKVNKNNNEVKR